MPAQLQAVRIRYPRLVRAIRAVVVLSLVLAILGGIGFAYEYHRYSRILDRRLAHNAIFAPSARLRLASPPLRPGRGTRIPVAAVAATRRRVAAYDALPPHLVQAVVAIEDRRFFEHSGINYGRTAECAVQDALTFHLACGGSTLTQQLARTSFLTQQKTLSRKVAEFIIARKLEQRLSKQQIFALYAAQINLGQRGPAPIKGFRQASLAYFGKDLNRLDLAQCALLAGMVHAPNFDNPYRHPDRAMHRRNVVLDAMVQTGAITQAQADLAKAEPLNLASFAPFEAAPYAPPSALG